MKNAIKKYLEKTCKNDTVLASHYDESKIDECVKYITDEARKRVDRHEGSQVVQIADNEVYQMARHWYLEFCPAKDGESAVNFGEQAFVDPNQLSLFG